MVPLDRAMTANSNHVSICSGLAAILNAKLLPARSQSPTCAEIPYCILALTVAFNMAASP